MKSNYKLMLTAVGAFALGALAIQGLHAQMKPPAYFIGEISVKDENSYTSEFLPLTSPLREITSFRRAWPSDSLMEVFKAGEELLNVQFPPAFKANLIVQSLSSVYIVQECCYKPARSTAYMRPEKKCLSFLMG